MYSDGCTPQNRNFKMSNALLHLNIELQVPIIQHFLEKDHTEMECDSVHSVIEQKVKDIYLPSDYLRITKEARTNPCPYNVFEVDHTFVKYFGQNKPLIYKSIRPGKRKGDFKVTQIRALRYVPNGTID